MTIFLKKLIETHKILLDVLTYIVVLHDANAEDEKE